MADRSFYEKVDAEGVDFPVAAASLRFRLESDRATIGRHSGSRGVHPDIDLSGPPTDTGVSHQHAVLVRQAGCTWAIVDLGSTNGTYLNDSSDPLPRNELIPIVDGDQIHVGAWTTLTLHSTAP
jgi:pSer/pThr/pTyr-binding forkhead associated (FHA) protein